MISISAFRNEPHFNANDKFEDAQKIVSQTKGQRGAQKHQGEEIE